MPALDRESTVAKQRQLASPADDCDCARQHWRATSPGTAIMAPKALRTKAKILRGKSVVDPG
jgi:hypothetical protein